MNVLQICRRFRYKSKRFGGQHSLMTSRESCRKKNDFREWTLIRYEDGESVHNQRHWGKALRSLDVVLDFYGRDDPVSLSAASVVCRLWRRRADARPCWKRIARTAGLIRIERATTVTPATNVVHASSSPIEEEDVLETDALSVRLLGRWGDEEEKDDSRIAIIEGKRIDADHIVCDDDEEDRDDGRLWKALYVASRASQMSYWTRLFDMLRPTTKELSDAAFKITLASGAFLIVAPVVVNGAVGFVFMEWQQSMVMWAIRTTVAEYSWYTASAAGAFVMKRTAHASSPVSRVMQASMAAVAGYLSHLAFVCLL